MLSSASARQVHVHPRGGFSGKGTDRAILVRNVTIQQKRLTLVPTGSLRPGLTNGKPVSRELAFIEPLRQLGFSHLRYQI